MSSCSQDFDEQMYMIEEEALKSTLAASRSMETELQFSSWSDFLDYYIQGEGREWFESQNIKLLGYDFEKEVIPSESDYIVKDDQILPIYNDTCNVNQFRLMSLSEARKVADASNMINYSKVKELSLSQYIGQKLSLVKLHWEYEGVQYDTECYVSSNSVVYDDFFENIRRIEIRGSHEKDVPIKRFSSASEPGGGFTTSYVFESEEVKWVRRNRVLASASCSLVVYGNGNSIESYQDYYNTHHEGIGVAVAQIKIGGFKTGPDGFCEYGYAVAAGTGEIKITWNGISASFSGGGNSAGGGGYVTPSMLD